ncbi:MAG: transporter [Myxococcaceae bacterium]|nr:transporter [Myxococcaceae bacterium]
MKLGAVKTSYPLPAQVSLANRATSELPAGKVRSLAGLLPFFRPYRGRLAAAALFLILSALTTLAFPFALRTLIDQGFVAPEQADPGARVMALREHFLGLFAVAVAFAVFAGARLYSVTWIGERVTSDLRNAVYRHVIAQSPAFFESARTGDVLSRLTTDTTLVQTVAGVSLSMGLRSAVTALGALIMLTVTNLTMTAQVWGLMALIVFPSAYFGRRVRKLSRDSQDRIADSSALAAETLNAIVVVQSYGQEAREADQFDSSTERAVRTALRRTRVRSLLVAFMVTATFGALLFSLYSGTQAVLRGELSAGQLGETVVYMIILVNSVAILSEVYGDFLRAAGATQRLVELLATRSAIESPASPVSLPRRAGGAAVELRDVSFSYPARPEHAALSHFSLQVRPGETVALVGPSGAGKSTVLQLLLRFYDASEGELLLDGVPLRDLALATLRERIAIVPQDSVIFSADALDNIRYGAPSSDEASVVRAAQAAHAHDFISQLPSGYRTFLGQRGVRLSGGQRQRISIARAILKNPPLLLLDEATSALDAESERMVQAALETAMQGRTTVVIAHRLATVQRADRIIVMDDGRIVDSGTHAELIARGGLYARLASLQFGLD